MCTLAMEGCQNSVIGRILNPFRPEDHGLPSEFLLTNLTEMKGCGCKVPRDILLPLLEEFGTEQSGSSGEIGIGLDSCVIPLRHEGLSLVQTTDFFYPLVDDPFLMGYITCANVLSDLYAQGVVDCDNLLMLLGVPPYLPPTHRDVIVRLFIQGFKKAAKKADTRVRGGQTVRCPWLLVGGVASSVSSRQEMLSIDAAMPGDLIVLTKPIGGQVAVNASEWLKKKDEKVEQLHLDIQWINKAMQQATEQMCRLNRNAARAAHKFGSHASTDVTGFGILGHADNLCQAQKALVRFVIEALPIIEYMDEIARKMPGGNGFNLFGGTSAETSGGLLVVLPADRAPLFCEEMLKVDGFPAWIIGRVEETLEGKREAIIKPGYALISVPSTIDECHS